MAIRFYITSQTGDSTTGFRPAHFEGLSYTAMDYGRDDTFLVMADVSAGQHTTIAANADVVVVPLNIDNEIGGALATVQAELEALLIPADWVTAQMTYKDLLRITAKAFQIMQRFSGLYGRSFFSGGITLSTRMNQMTAGQRAELEAAITSLAATMQIVIDLSSIVGASTVRHVLRTSIDQIPSRILLGFAQGLS